MPSTRYTVRLPPALDTAVQEHMRTASVPFATLIRDALAAYLADLLPPPTATRTPSPTSADTLMDLQDRLIALTVRVELLEQSAPTAPPTPADSADTIRALQAQIEDVTTRAQVIE